MSLEAEVKHLHLSPDKLPAIIFACISCLFFAIFNNQRLYCTLLSYCVRCLSNMCYNQNRNTYGSIPTDYFTCKTISQVVFLFWYQDYILLFVQIYPFYFGYGSFFREKKKNRPSDEEVGLTKKGSPSVCADLLASWFI